MSESSLHAKVNREVGKSFRYGVADILLTEIHQLCVLCPLLFTLIYSLLPTNKIQIYISSSNSNNISAWSSREKDFDRKISKTVQEPDRKVKFKKASFSVAVCDRKQASRIPQPKVGVSVIV